MQVITSSSIFHRTQLLPLARARSFARCLARNARFEAVTVEEHLKARGDRRWFVQYRPAAAARQLDLIAAQMDAREARATEQADNYAFLWNTDTGAYDCLNLVSGAVYATTEQECSCPDSAHRGSVVGPCKHSRLLRQQLAAAPAPDPAQEAAEQAAAAAAEAARRARAQADRALWD